MKITKSTRTVSLIIVGIGLAVNGYSQPFLTNGLVAYYPFNGNGSDESGNGYNLTAFGSPRYSGTDRFGRTNASVDLSGGANYFMLNSLPPQSMKTPPFTATYWRKGNGADGAMCIEDVPSGLWAIGGTGDTIHIDENVNVAGGRNNLSFHTGIDSSQWNSIVVVWNGTQSACYVNGRLIWTNSLPSPGALSSTHRFYVGADPYASWDYYNGQLDDIRIYNRALSSNEVAAEVTAAAQAVAQAAVQGEACDHAGRAPAHRRPGAQRRAARLSSFVRPCRGGSRSSGIICISPVGCRRPAVADRRRPVPRLQPPTSG